MLPYCLQLFTTASFVMTTCLNLTLFCLLQLKSAAIGRYRRFFVLSIVFDQAYSLCEWITTPFYYTDKGFAVIIGISIFRYSCVELFFFLWTSLFMDIIIIVTHSFVYRYAIVTRSRILSAYENLVFAVPMTACTMLFGVIITGMVFRTFYPISSQYKRELVRVLSKEAHIAKRMILGFNADSSPGTFAAGFTIIFFFCFLFSICSVIITRLGMEINRMTRSVTISERSRSNQRRMLRMLIFQTLNPVLTVYLPSAYRVITIIVKTTNHEEIHWILSFFFALFPVLNPLIVICCVQDYQTKLLKAVGWVETKRSSTVTGRLQSHPVKCDK